MKKLAQVLTTLLLLALPTIAAETTPKIIVIGDSTVENYPENHKQRGWGQMLDSSFKPEVKIINLAKSGRSTKTFKAEGRWKKALDQTEKGDFILIQFGHNDSHEKSRPESTDADGNYTTLLKEYITETRAKGAHPILVTPMTRFTFAKDGTLDTYMTTDKGHRYDLAPFVKAMKKVAKETNTHLIDLQKSSRQYLLKIGKEKADELYTDKAHFTHEGAQIMANLIITELRTQKLPLTKYLKPVSK